MDESKGWVVRVKEGSLVDEENRYVWYDKWTDKMMYCRGWMPAGEASRFKTTFTEEEYYHLLPEKTHRITQLVDVYDVQY